MTKKIIDLSIIIPVYNAGPLLNRCLDSIFNQATQYNYEVILVDDGSTDNSVNIIQSRKESNIQLLQQQNAGPAAARNHGLSIAIGQYCAYLDADDYWEQGFIEKTITFLNKHTQCVAVNVAQRHLTISKSFEAPLCYKSYKESFIIKDFFAFWAKNIHVCTGSVVLQTSIIKTIGGMRQDLRNAEDLELWFLISTYGEWGFIPEILFVSDGSNITKTRGWLNKMMIRWQNAPSIAIWEQRILERLPSKLPLGYLQARGRIARYLIYSQLLSGRIKLSRIESLKYGNYFIKDTIGKLMNLAKYTPLTWWLLAKFLQYREYNRK